MSKVNELYLHVGNSGVKFKVIDEAGPTVVVSSSAFGNLVTEHKFFVTPEGLTALAEMFKKASEQTYSEKYVYAAYVPKETGAVPVASKTEDFGFSLGGPEADLPMDSKGNVYEVCESCQ